MLVCYLQLCSLNSTIDFTAEIQHVIYAMFYMQDIKEEDLINYYNKKQYIVPRLQYDLYFNTSQSFDPKVKKDSARSQKEILNNIYNEVCKQRPNKISVAQNIRRFCVCFFRLNFYILPTQNKTLVSLKFNMKFVQIIFITKFKTIKFNEPTGITVFMKHVIVNLITSSRYEYIVFQ